MAEPEKRQETDTTDEERKPRLEIKLTQVAGGALAAVTAAVLGARLGVAGTVLGAGVASVVTTVGSALYQHSLERTRETVKVVATKLPIGGGSGEAERTAVGAPLETTRWGDGHDRTTTWVGRPMTHDDATQIVRPVGSTAVQPAVGAGQGEETTRIIRRPEPAGEAGAAGSTGTRAGRQGWQEWLRQRWTRVAAVSALGFVLGMLVVTGVEWVRGEPLSGGGSGSTVGEILRGGPAPQMRPEPEQEAPVPTGHERPTGDGGQQRPTGGATSEAPVPSTSRQPGTSASEAPPTTSAPKPSPSQQPEKPQPTTRPQQPTGTPNPGTGTGGTGGGTGTGAGTGAGSGSGQGTDTGVGQRQTPVPGVERQG
ncbi:hypothetical protein [Streptoalloteichus tenebrarius]|nr:hypothetical protein [Streptoalloteichus tenebrarius]